MPTQDSQAGNGGTSPVSASLNHGANVFILISIMLRSSTVISSVTVAGNNATLIGSQGQLYLYYYFAAAAANDTITVTLTTSVSVEFFAEALKQVPTSAPFYEAVTKANGLSVTIAAGTLGRRIIQCVGSVYENFSLGGGLCTGACGQNCPLILIVPTGSGQLEIGEASAQWVSGTCLKETRVCNEIRTELNYEDTETQQTETCSASASCEAPTITSYTIALAVLPQAADFTHQGSQLV